MIEIRGCSKAFGTLMAVSKVSLEIGEREVFGLVTRTEIYDRKSQAFKC